MTPRSAAGLTGVFGGTFNPIHLGHLRAAEEVCEVLDLRRMVFVPSADPPLKRGGSDPLAPATERVAWVRMATGDNPRFEVDDLELRREGPSYSVDTLGVWGERLSPQKPVFVIGCDAFAELSCWREPQKLLTLCHFAVIARPPHGSGGLGDWLPAEFHTDFDLAADGQGALHRSAGTWIRRLEIAALDISATDIRRRIRERRSVRYLVPESVRGAIVASVFYTEGSDT